MSESFDLRKVLKDWPYDPEHDARITHGEDGREILQVRTPLGIEQYELDGRPDGDRPHGAESWLEYFAQRLERKKAEGREIEFELKPRECAELFNEGTIYYFRYVRLFQLRDWNRTVRDTSRNLRVFDLVHRYARREEDQQYLEKWRPYILRMRASAEAMMALEKNAHADALLAANQAIEQIQSLDEVDDETFQFERERSLAALRDLAEQIQKNRPLSELEKLEKQMNSAVEQQEFERAAQLRDRIRGLKQT
jgi:hypothetical protein